MQAVIKSEVLAIRIKSNNVTGKAIGALARSQKLSPERRSEIARNAALARHSANKKLKAIRKGNFKDDFGFDVECYVLSDDKRTAVISQQGMAVALGLSGGGGTVFRRFASGKIISEYLGPKLIEKIENPLVFQSSLDGPDVTSYGYDVTILIDVCQAIILANSNNKLTSNQSNLVKNVQVITSASDKSGIQELVYKLTGFDSTKEQFIAAFKQFVNDEAKKFEKEFPIELYEQWARLYSLTIPTRGYPWEFKHLTVKHIYIPLAKSNGKTLQLLRINKVHDGDSRKKLFQFLNDIGMRALRMQFGRVLEMAESSKNKKEYEKKIVERFGGQEELDF